MNTSSSTYWFQLGSAGFNPEPLFNVGDQEDADCGVILPNVVEILLIDIGLTSPYPSPKAEVLEMDGEGVAGLKNGAGVVLYEKEAKFRRGVLTMEPAGRRAKVCPADCCCKLGKPEDEDDEDDDEDGR